MLSISPQLRNGTTTFVIVLFSATIGAACSQQNSGDRVSAPVSREEEGNRPRSGAARDSYADVVARVAPAVVTVRSEKYVRAPQQFPFTQDPFFWWFFGPTLPPPRGGIQRGLGSGVIVQPDGYCLTNHHVIDGAQQIKVEFSDGRTVEAKLVGSDPPSDVAVLKVDAKNLPILRLGDSERVRVGDIVLALGNPLGVGQTVTMGIISAKGRTTGLGDGSFEDFLQTDAPINQGNSGGPLVNTLGEMIGINSQIVSPSGGNVGIGFAIPSNMARGVMEQLIKTGKVRRAQLGVSVQRITSDIASSLGLKDLNGALVSSVMPGSPAEQAGIQRGDVIVALNGDRVEDTNSFRNRIAAMQPGREVTLTIVRGGRQQQVKARLREFRTPDRADARMSPGPAGEGTGQLGLAVQPLTPEIAAQLRLPENSPGLLVTDVNPTGPAAEAGIQRGDVILEINGQGIRSASEVPAAIRRTGSRPALILIYRNGQTFYLTVHVAR